MALSVQLRESLFSRQGKSQKRKYKVLRLRAKEARGSMKPTDRIRRVAYAIAQALGSHDHARYLEIAAVVLYADESVNNLDEWGAITDPEFQRAALEGAEDIRSRTVVRRHKRAA